MVINPKNKKGATLVELIIMILLTAIIGAAISGTIVFFIQLFMYSPRQLNAQKTAQELAYTMIEGNQDARGMRYTRSIIDANATQFSYTYGYPTVADQLSVRFRWNSGNNHFYQSTSTDAGSTWSSEVIIPYYTSSDLVIDGKVTPSVIFTYKKAAEANWTAGVDALTNIRRVVISMNVKTGGGAFKDFQASYDLVSSVEIKNYN